jgi:hypothetical protein
VNLLATDDQQMQEMTMILPLINPCLALGVLFRNAVDITERYHDIQKCSQV